MNPGRLASRHPQGPIPARAFHDQRYSNGALIRGVVAEIAVPLEVVGEDLAVIGGSPQESVHSKRCETPALEVTPHQSHVHEGDRRPDTDPKEMTATREGLLDQDQDCDHRQCAQRVIPREKEP